MVFISQRSEYAIQALLELALRAGAGRVTITEIAAAQRLPRTFLAAILARLKQAGVVVSERGTRGGYRLARDPRQITVGQVVRLLDGPVIAGAAGRGTPDVPSGASVLSDVRREIGRAVEQVLDRTTLAHLAEREALVPNYCI